MYGFKPGAKPQEKAPQGKKIAGPGNGTSDSIKTDIPKGSYIMPADSTQQIGQKALGKLGQPVPVNVSNGEYQMPPEQVHAVGVQALNQMRDATHTPAPAGFKPQNDGLYFADGGSPAEEERRRLPGNPLAVTYGDMQRAPSLPQPSAPSPAGAISAATPPRPSAPAAGQPPAQEAGFGATTERAQQGAPVSFSSMQREPNVPRTGQPRQMPQGEPIGTSGVIGGFQAAGQRAAAGVQSAADQVAQAGRDFVAGGQAMTDQAATAAGSAVDAASGALAYLNRGDPVRDAANAIGGFFSRSAQQARGADYGGQPEAAAAPQPVAAPPATTPPSAASSTPAGDAQSTPAASQAAPAATAPTQQPMQGPAPEMSVRPTSAQGINRIDNAPGLKSPLFTNLPAGQAVSEMQGGTVNSFDMQAGNEAMARANAIRGGAETQATGFQPDRGGSGGVIASGADDDAQNRNEMFARWGVDSALFKAGIGKMGKRDAALLDARLKQYEAVANQGMRRREIASKEGQAAADRAALLDRTAMQESGANARSFSRDDIDRMRVGIEGQAKGFEARGMERAEKLYAAYENAKTPEERAAVAEQLRVMSGKDAPNRFTVVPGGQEFDPTANMVLNRPAMVLNNQTGQPVNLGGAQASRAAMPPPNHIDALKKNPNQAAQFDAIYGEGAAARYLGAN